MRPLASLLHGAGLALLACGAAQSVAARELTAPTEVSAPRQAVAEAGAPVAGSQPTAALPAELLPVAPGESAASPADSLGSAPGIGSAAEPPTAGTAAPLPEAQSTASPPAANATDAADGISAGMPVWKLLVIDARSVFTAPAHWTGGEWALFGVGVAGVAALTQADKHLRTEVLRSNSSFETHLADGFRPFGSYAGFGVLGAFYAGSLLAHDVKAQETALDGLIASGIAAGVITPILKEVVGRSRPSTHKGVYDFHPFSGSASFPSGETTEAFAIGSVIATEYPNTWVQVLAYGTATLVGFARMREDAHWASDVVTGALIGTCVGRLVVHVNQRLRARVSVAPLIAPGAQGLTIHTAF